MSEQDFIEDLKRVSSKTARILTQKVDITSLTGTPPGVKAATGPSKERLSKYLDSYEKAVKDTIKGLKRPNLLTDIVVVIITVVLLIISVVYSNISGVATTAGVSGVSILSVVKSTTDAYKVYNADATKLNISIDRLRGMLAICGDDDSECLKKVQDAIDAAFKALGEASK